MNVALDLPLWRILAGLPLAIGGLFIPGWFVARRSGIAPTWWWAHVISALMLVNTVLAVDALGLPITCLNVTIGLAIWTLGSGWVMLRRPNAALTRPNLPPTASPLTPWLIGVVGLASGLLILRLIRQPLLGPDHAFRWEYLALRLWKDQTLGFYPPHDSGDFAHYFYPDGIPPLVSTLRWWLYAACGGRIIVIASVFLASLQWSMALVVVHRLAGFLAPPPASWLACALLATTPLFFYAVLLGQDNALVALAVGGISLAWRQHDVAVRPGYGAATAGAAAALALLTREYGVLILLSGIAIGWLCKARGKELGVYCSIAAVSAGAWYVRCLWRTGNPFGALDIAGLFPDNPVHTALYIHNRAIFGWAALDGVGWRLLATRLFQVAPVAMLAGLPLAVINLRRAAWLVAGIAISLAIWVSAAGYTFGGPMGALRVLAPALLLLVAIAAAGLSQLPFPRWVVIATFVLYTVYGLANDLTTPLLARQLPLSEWADSGLTRSAIDVPDKRLELLEHQRGRIVSDDFYLLAAAMKAGQGNRFISIWSPEATPLFAGADDPRRALVYARNHNIRFVAFWHEPSYRSFLQHYAFFRYVENHWAERAPLCFEDSAG